MEKTKEFILNNFNSKVIKLNLLHNFFIGVDIGQAQDYTAISIVEKITMDRYELDEISENIIKNLKEFSEYDGIYHVRRIERLPLGTSYGKIATYIKNVMDIRIENEKIEDSGHVIVDATGCGRPVVEMIKKEVSPVISVTITGGNEVFEKDRRSYNVPKIDLISNLQVLLETRQLKFTKEIPDIVLKELQNYKVKINENANAIFEPRQQQHDDMVLSIALACWYAKKQKQLYITTARFF